MLNVKNTVDVNTSVYVKPRLNILYMVIYEMAEHFGVSQIALDIIKKGVLDKQYIKRIIIQYKNSDDEIVGEIYFNIDWEKYEINASNADGANITLKSNESIHSQISAASDTIIDYVDKMRKELNVKDIECFYWTRTDSELTTYGITQEEADNELELYYVDSEDKRNISPEFENNFEIIFGLLDELTCGVRRN